MTAVITISSSPERIAPHTPTPPTDDSRALRRTSVPDSSPDSVISPSELCRLPMRSKYFGKKGLAEEPPTQALDATAEKTTSNRPGRKKKPAGEKQQAKGQKPIAKATAAAPGESSLERTTNAPKKTTETKKKRAGKGDKLANKVLTGRVAKAGSGQPQEPMKQSKASATPERSSRQKSIRDSVDDEEDLQLEAAMKRRMDWTPTQDTPKETEEMIGNDREVDEEGKLLGFGNLMAGYNFSGDVPAPHNNTESFSDGGPTKRRRIDLVDPIFCPPKHMSLSVLDEESENASSDKAPEPKKKPRRQTKKFTSITARMTAQYNNDHLEPYASSNKQATDNTESEAAVNSKGRKSRKKAASKSKPDVIILSPEDAVKSVNDQDLVFGTCSQLEREDSPTMLKNLQAAIRESENVVTASQFTPSVLQTSMRGLPSAGTVSRFPAPKNLWSVASRDLTGSVIEAEVLDLTKSSKTEESSPPTANGNNDGKCRDLRVDLPEISSAEAEPAKADETTATSTQKSTRPTKVNKKQPENKATKEAGDHGQMPNYNSFTDAQLSKNVAEYGFKPVKARRKMIELLERCWQSQHGPSANANDNTAEKANVPAPASQPPTTKVKTAKPKQVPKATKPKEKPKAKGPAKSSSRSTVTASAAKELSKDAAPKPKSAKSSSMFSYMDVEEIEDSEEELIPSPSRLQKQLDLLAPPKDTAASLTVSTHPPGPSRRAASKTASDNTTIQNTEGLADRITKAVRAQPPRLALLGTRKGPTWQEKIVMYDPIIIEDFTAWLNTEGLGSVNEDREVHLGFVKQWCEQRGICCCYRRINKR